MRLFYLFIINQVIISVLCLKTASSQCNANVNGNITYSSLGGGCTATPSSVTLNNISNGDIFTFNTNITVSGNMLLDFQSANTTIIINSGVTVTISGDLNLNGNAGVKDFIVNGTLIVLNNFNAQNNIDYGGNGIIRVDGTWQGNGNASDCPAPCNLVFDVPNCLQSTDPICQDVTSNPFLPITLVSFAGRIFNQNHIDFKWQTANELNNHYFSLQGSADGKNFIDFAKIEGRGTNNQIQNYQYSWLVNDLRWQYFRLKQVDFDGKEHIYNSIFIPQSFHSVKVYPQAFNKRLYQVEIPASLNGEVRLFSMDGKEIRKITFNTHSEDKVLEIDLSNLNTQFFLLKIQHQNGVDVFKIL
jgi:hypothetical protein